MIQDQFSMLVMMWRHCARGYASWVWHESNFFRYCSGLNIKWTRAYQLCAMWKLEHILDPVIRQWCHCKVMVIFKRHVGPVNHHRLEKCDRSGYCINGHLMFLTSGHWWHYSSDQIQNVWRFLVSNVSSYSRIKRKQFDKITRIVFGILLSIILSIRWAYFGQGHWKSRDQKSQTENFMFEWHDICFRSVFGKNAKMALGHFEQPTSDKIRKSGKCRIPREQHKKWQFRHSKYNNSITF